MKLRFAALAGACFFGLAAVAWANPDNYRYKQCRHRYVETLGKKHRELHQEAVKRDEANHLRNRDAKNKVRESHQRIQSYLDRGHRELAQRDARLRAGNQPSRDRDHTPKVSPPAPPPKPLDRAPGLKKDNPGLHLGHDKEHPGKHKGHDKEPPGQAKKKGKPSKD